jgi:GLPGLI family protein
MIENMKIRLTTLFLIIINGVYAQHSSGVNRELDSMTAIDDCLLTVDFLYTFHKDTLGNPPCSEKYRLDVGQKYSRYYSLYGEKADSVYAMATKAYNPFKEMGLGSNETISYADCHYNYPKKGILTVSVGYISHFIYEEEMPVMEWRIIQDDTTTILGYPCNKACVRFRGRDYIAWFTSDIPISYGPWKFNGLPGTILLIAESSGHFEWRVTRMYRAKERKILINDMEKTNSYQLSRKDFLKIERKFWEDPVSLYLTANRQFYVYKNGKFIEAKPGDVKIPYIPPLELE